MIDMGKQDGKNKHNGKIRLGVEHGDIVVEGTDYAKVFTNKDNGASFVNPDGDKYKDCVLMWYNRDLSRSDDGLHLDFVPYDEIPADMDTFDRETRISNNHAYEIDKYIVGFNDDGKLLKQFSIPFLVRVEQDGTDREDTCSLIALKDFTFCPYVNLTDDMVPDAYPEYENYDSGEEMQICNDYLKYFSDRPKYTVPDLYNSYQSFDLIGRSQADFSEFKQQYPQLTMCLDKASEYGADNSFRNELVEGESDDITKRQMKYKEAMIDMGKQDGKITNAWVRHEQDSMQKYGTVYEFVVQFAYDEREKSEKPAILESDIEYAPKKWFEEHKSEFETCVSEETGCEYYTRSLRDGTNRYHEDTKTIISSDLRTCLMAAEDLMNQHGYRFLSRDNDEILRHFTNDRRSVKTIYDIDSDILCNALDTCRDKIAKKSEASSKEVLQGKLADEELGTMGVATSGNMNYSDEPESP